MTATRPAGRERPIPRLRRAASAARSVGALLAAVLASFAPLTLAADGSLLMVSGRVEILRPTPGGSPSTLRPATGDEVSAGDLVSTGDDGRVQIRFSDGSVVSLQPRTRFSIDEYRFDANGQRGFFGLMQGALRTVTGAIGKRDHQDYRLITPTATVGVRGTEFVVEETVCDPDCRPGRSAGLRVAVSQGRVVVTNQTGSADVAAGSAVYVADEGSPIENTEDRPVLSSPTMPASPSSDTAQAGRAGAADGSSASRDGAEPMQAALGAGIGSLPSDAAGTNRSRSSDGTLTPVLMLAAGSGDGAANRSSGGAQGGSGPGDAASTRPGATAPNGTGTGSTGSGTGGSGPGDTVPGDTVLGDTVPGDTVPGDTVPGDTVSGDTVPGDTVSGDTGSGDTGSGDTGTVDTGTVDTGTVDTGTVGTGTVGSGGTGSGGTGTGGTVTSSGGTGTDTGTGSVAPTLTLLPNGSYDVRLLGLWLLQTPKIQGLLSSSGSRALLDENGQLLSIGVCPGTRCLSRGTASVADAGIDTIASWGRWVDGAARAGALGLDTSHPLSPRAGMHYLVGIPTLTMPTGGSAGYSLAGATQPTFSDGSQMPGTFTGSAVVQFGSGLTTRVALDAQASFAGDATYRFTSTGGLADPAASNLTMNRANSFEGTLAVQTGQPTSALGCSAGQACNATVTGTFLGPEAARIGLGYTIGRTGGSETTINGVGVLRRNP